MKSDAVEVEIHAPERRGSGVHVACGGCCCCCCCCLHSVAGLAGAAITSAVARPKTFAIAVYWWAVVAVCAIVGVTGALSGDAIVTALALALGMPLYQLIASLISVLVVAILAPRGEKGMQLKQIGKITLWAFVCAFGGTAVMVAGLMMLSAVDW